MADDRPNLPTSTVSGPKRRSVLAYLVGCVLLGALLAPLVMRGLLWLGRNLDGCSGLRDLEFERVATRSVLVVLVLTCWPALKRSHLLQADRLGLAWTPSAWRLALVGGITGILSLGAVFAVGGWAGAYVLDVPSSSWPWKVLGMAVGALGVSLLEEVLFRGVLFQAWRDRGTRLGAILFSSALFSLVHFIRPEPVVGVAHPHWYSGLAILPYMFRWVHATYHYFPMMLTLFLMGVTLCLVVDRYRSLWPAIGLHAGWILAIRGFDLWLARESALLPFWFGGTEGIAKSYATLAFAVAMFVLVLVGARTRRPAG